MNRLAVATIVAKNHISYARVLAESFREHHSDVPFHVLLADEIDGLFDPANEPFELLTLKDLSIPHQERFRFNYAQQELSYACTPYLLEMLLDRGFTAAAFLKQESLVLDDLSPVMSEMLRHPITLTPHLLEPLIGEDAAARELNILQSGIYNVGFLGVSDSTAARRFLSWWQDRVYRHCRHDVPGGMHFEQRWLDLAPVYFEGTHMVRDPGFNLGHWNLSEREVRVSASGLTAGGSTLRFMRFSGFEPEQPEAVTRYNGRLEMGDIGPAADLFRRYARLLDEAGYQETSLWKYSYDSFDNGVGIPFVARQIYRDLGVEAEAFGDPFESSGSAGYFNWLREPAGRESINPSSSEGADDGGIVSNLWQGVYERRPDVRAAFPDLAGSDHSAFLDWAERYGINEHSIPEVFHPKGRP
ncbi:MAG: hypothetical protein HZB44_05375 [Actinobacteria bacterium]|nr:hypothetical protein [Actinomycetota bacterium]